MPKSRVVSVPSDPNRLLLLRATILVAFAHIRLWEHRIVGTEMSNNLRSLSTFACRQILCMLSVTEGAAAPRPRKGSPRAFRRINIGRKGAQYQPDERAVRPFLSRKIGWPARCLSTPTLAFRLSGLDSLASVAW